MSLGSKKTPKVKAPTLSTGYSKDDAPPPMARGRQFSDVMGNRFVTRMHRGQEVSSTRLRGPSRQIVSGAQHGIRNLSDQLRRSEPQRQRERDVKSNELYGEFSNDINQNARLSQNRTRSRLSQTLGGSMRSTFGNNLLAQLERSRLKTLSDARGQSRQLAYQFQNDEDTNRMRRLSMFQGVLDSYNNRAMGSSQLGSALLSGERDRLTGLSMKRAELDFSAQQFNQQQAMAARQRRSALLGQLIKVGGAVAGSFAGPVGSAVASAASNAAGSIVSGSGFSAPSYA